MMVPEGDGQGLFEGTGRWIQFSRRPRMEYLVRGREGDWRRVDVMVERDDESIAVEVTVTNGLSSSRVKSLKAMGHLVLEIDLTGFSLTDFDEAEIREVVINRTSCKIWRKEGGRSRKVSSCKPDNDEETLNQAAAQTDLFEQVHPGFWQYRAFPYIGLFRFLKKLFWTLKSSR